MDLKRVVFTLLAICIVLVVLLGMQFAVPGSPVAMLAVSVPSEYCEGPACYGVIFPVAMYLLFSAIIIAFVLLLAYNELKIKAK